MDLSAWGKKAGVYLKKYRYSVLILLVGIAILLFSGKKQADSSDAPIAASVVTEDFSESLARILSQIKGVGKVQVMLTMEVGETTVYQTDESISESADAQNIKKDTVIITDAKRNQSPVVRYVISPSYRGAVIVCQGADDAQVRLAIVEAVSKATGIGANHISVLKMK